MLTWKERIVGVFEGRIKKGEWFTHAKIMELVDNGPYKKPMSLTSYLIELVRTGHLERTIMPMSMKENRHYRPQREYLYRYTGKPYVKPDCFKKLHNEKHTDESIADMRLGSRIYLLNMKLPKWYRDMMK